MANPQKVLVTISRIEHHGDGVYSLGFVSERRLPRFKPGQFLHLALDEFDPSTGFWPDSRVFSIATAPTSNEVTIVYSVKGAYTARMERELAKGRSVWLKFPYGSFIIDEQVSESDPAILVAGGTGFTPFVAFLEDEIKRCSSRKIHLFYGVRKSSLILFPQLLESLIEKCANFSLSLMIEDNYEQGPLFAAPGRLNAENILKTHWEFEGAPIFLAGPPVMMDTFKKAFFSAGIAENKIIMDEWE